ncbi:glycosyltransferase family 39 protein [Phormidium tenue FACHB-886]|nr:glycosyltransferase family 39 protein [Phormidium tenue FACHB-886]
MANPSAIDRPLVHLQSLRRTIPPRWRLLLIACIMIGITLRFANLDGKVYQYDETFSSLRVSGYTEAQAVQQLASAGVISPQDLQVYQEPQSETSIADTVKGLAIEEAQLTPLYFVFARFWAEGFGSSAGAIRSLSAIASVLAFPAMFWLCWELFESRLAGWLGMTILAVSPFQLLYAQEARPNSLWATTILLSSAALLRSLRLQTVTSWGTYAVVMALNFYAYLFSVLVAIAHVCYVLVVERLRWNARLKGFGVALSIALLAFLPWMLVIFSTLQQIESATTWTAQAHWLTLREHAKQWLFYLSASFVDPGDKPLGGLRYFFSAALWLVRLLVLYGFYLLCRRTPLRVWLFVLSLTWIPALALLLPDLLLGGTRSAVPRYMVPFYLGCQLVITYLLSQKLRSTLSATPWRQWFWRGATAVILTASLLSCGLIIQSNTWWNKMISNNNPAIAQLINQHDRPLVISDAGLGDLLSLSHYLDPKVNLLVRPHCYTDCQVDRAYRELETVPFLPPIPDGYSDVFLFRPRPKPIWVEQLQQANYSLEVLANRDDEWLWRVK